MVKFKKQILCLAAILFAVCLTLGVFFATGFSGITSSADAEDGRVTPLDLMSVHKVDYVMGPLATKLTSGTNSGKYVDAKGNLVYDENGTETNNVYGIPADRYFNIEAYIFTNDNTSAGTRVLRGFKKGITTVYRANASASVSSPINSETGMSGGSLSVYFDNANLSSENKYMLIIPDSITSIGTGSGAFFCSTTTCMNGGTCLGHQNGGRTLSSSDTDYQFTDFSNFIYNGTAPNGYFSPRERIAGIYFNSTSKLASIDGGVQTLNESTSGYTGTTRHNTKGKSAIAALDNMKFCVLPNSGTLTRIGDYAFNNCTQLRDFNIPESVESLGQSAFNSCSSLVHLSVPSKVTKLQTNSGAAVSSSGVFNNMTRLAEVENNSSVFYDSDFINSGTTALLNCYTSSTGSSKLLVVGNSATDTGANGYYLCKNVRGADDTLATISSPSSKKYTYQKDQWYAIALAGKEDTTGDVVHIFPDEVSDSSGRRENIKYDYLNSNGQMCKNLLGSEVIKSYDIGKSFASITWCTAAVLPDCVNVIGDEAFSGSHLEYLELHATKLGNKAFYNNYDLQKLQQQYYYIHNEMTEWGSFPFNYSSTFSSNITRNYIFGDKTVYDAHVQSNGSLKTGSIWMYNDTNPRLSKTNQRYQIPVYLNVDSADGDVNISSYSDLDDRFFYDDDYANRKTSTVDANKNGTYKILYTKRLSGHDFNYTKQANGSWANNTANVPFVEPVIEGMSKTQWYSANTYAEVNKITSVSSVYSQSATDGVNAYTRKIASITLKPQTLQYKEGMTEADYAYSKLLGIFDDYKVTCTKFTPISGSTDIPTYVNKAGTYDISVNLNSKWGEWTTPSTLQNAITVNQISINLCDFANVPKFWVSGGTQSPLLGDNIALYEYGDGYYTTERDGLIAISTETVTNSYAVYAGRPLTLGAESDWSLYDITSNSGYSATNSGRYDASFTFTVKDANNYKFVYEDVDDSAQLFADNKIAFTLEREGTANITKRWFIVRPFNWLVDYNSAGGESSIDDQFVLAEKKNNGTYSAIYEWEYNYRDMDIRVNIPKLANGTGNLTATITLESTEIATGIPVANFRNYNNNAMPAGEYKTEIATDIPVADLRNYINNAMPAGEYKIVISAPQATVNDSQFDAFETVFTITVKPNSLDISKIKEYLINSGKAFERARDGNLFLFDEGDEWEQIIYEINKSLNNNRSNSEANYWTQKAQDGYYGEIELKFNLDALHTSTYYIADELPVSGAPIEPGEYIVYYSISAPNYITVGETDKENDSRRNYSFSTVIFDQISASDLANKINEKDYTYTGSNVYANVDYSVHYTYSFDDTVDNAYVNVGTYHVTITIGNPLLMRWKDTDTTGITFDEENQVITIAYDISAATNSWRSTPQMIGWNYSGFDSSTHKIIGTLEFQEGAKIYYRLKSKDSDDWVIAEFTVNENGEVEEGVKSALNVLPAGEYYLYSRVEAIGKNVIAYETDQDLWSTVYISRATNLWTSSPNVIRWTWGEYDESVNVFSATPLFSAAGLQVKYTILNSSYKPIANLINFSSEDEGSDAAKALGDLDAGIYYIVATLAGGDNYNFLPINSAAIGNGVDYSLATVQKVQFEIYVAQNSWIASPTVSGWAYNGYSNGFSIPQAQPKHGNAADVVYTVYKNKKAVAGLENFKLPLADGSDEVKVLNGLDAGEYALKVFVPAGDNKNYKDFDWEYIFHVSKAANIITASITGWTYGETDIKNNINISITYSVGVKYVLSRDNKEVGKYYTLDDFIAAMTNTKNLPAIGRYELTINVPESKNYSSIEDRTFSFIIDKGANRWIDVPVVTGWAYNPDHTSTDIKIEFKVAYVSDSDNYTVRYAKLTQNGDTFEIDKYVDNPVEAGYYYAYVTYRSGDNYKELEEQAFFEITKGTNEFTRNPAISGTLVYGAVNIEWIRPLSKFELTSAISVLVDGETVDGGINEVKSYIENSNLNAGTHTITVTLPGSNNFDAITTDVTFVIAKSPNGWTSIPEDKTYSWEFGDDVDVERAIGTARAMHGTVNIHYVTSDGNIVYDLPTSVGEYKIVYSVTGTDNYNSLEKEVPFEIVRALKDTWSVGFGVSSYWSWNEYDKTNNVFRGIPTSGGAVSYEIYDGEKLILSFTLDENGFVSDEIAQKLNALEAKTYVLTGHVAETSDYRGFDIINTELVVRQAENIWTVSPSIAPWVVGEWQAETDSSPTGNTPQGQAKYGVVTLTIVDKNGNSYFIATRDSDGTYKVEKNLFKDSVDGTLAGTYTLIASVSAVAGQYKGISESVIFQVYTSSEDIPSNYWLRIPSITNWTAGNAASQPVGRPFRGEDHTTFTFFVLNSKDIWEEISFDAIENYGRYKMVVEVYPEDKTNRDHMIAEIEFNVEKRINNWTISPFISNWFLSDNPSDPEFETTEESTGTVLYTVLYKVKDMADSTAVPERPSKAGDYTMIVIAKAAYCEDLRAEVDFKILLSANSWIELPTIANWSEEFAPNDPWAVPMYGQGEVVYTYYTLDYVQLDEKPTTEGTYIMRATVELFGYETLTGETIFTIEPAFDMTFIIIDTILALVASILTIIVITIAVRRKKQC